MRQEEHEQVLSDLEAKHAEKIKEIEANHAEKLEELNGKIEAKEKALKFKDETIEKLDSEILEFKGEISELEKDSKESTSKKKAKTQFVGLISSIRHNGKRYLEGTPKKDVPEELQKKFAHLFKIIEK